MNDCHVMKAKLGRLIDAELKPADQAVIQSHLEVCPNCRQEFDELKRVSTSLDRLAVPPVPDRLGATVMARVRNDVSAGTPAPGMFRFWKDWSAAMRVAACATATIACVAGILLGSAMSARPGQADADIAWLGIASGAPIAHTYGDSSR